jgi:hypothetical protein
LYVWKGSDGATVISDTESNSNVEMTKNPAEHAISISSEDGKLVNFAHTAIDGSIAVAIYNDPEQTDGPTACAKISLKSFAQALQIMVDSAFSQDGHPDKSSN